jgi:hypothetical protein
LPLKSRDVKKALTAKGFEEDEERDHLYYFLQYEGKKTAIFTKISHSVTEISDRLCSLMARQIKLTNSQFRKLVDCSLKHEAYIRHLVEEKYLQPKATSPIGRSDPPEI